jgi:hypothetical protein
MCKKKFFLIFFQQKRREKKLEEHHKAMIEDLKEKIKHGDVDIGPDINNFFPTDTNLNLPLLIKLIVKFENVEQLKETIESFSSKLDTVGVKYHFYGLSTKNHTLTFSNEHFTLIVYDKEPQKSEKKEQFDKLPKEKRIENLNILHMNSDWIGMMKKVQTLMAPYEAYFYLEEGWKICDHAIHNFVSIYYWSLKIRDHWLAISVSPGFSGVFFKAGDSTTFIENLYKSDVMNVLNPKPYDTVLKTWWSPYSHLVGRNSFTFRYNLLIKDKNPAKCFQGSNHQNYFLYDRFDTDQCQKYLMSPCEEPNLQSTLKFVGRDSIESKSIIRFKERSVLMDKLKLRVIASEAHETCDEICGKQSLKCSEESIQFANSCEFMKSRFQCDECLIGNEHFGPFVPFFSSKLCFLSDQSQFKCNFQKKIDGVRICPCKNLK